MYGDVLASACAVGLDARGGARMPIRYKIGLEMTGNGSNGGFGTMEEGGIDGGAVGGYIRAIIAVWDMFGDWVDRGENCGSGSYVARVGG